MTTTQAEVTLFKNVHGNVNVALPTGETVAFINGKFFTTDEELQSKLEYAARRGEFGVYIDTNEDKIDPNFATPMDQLKKKLREELMEELRNGGQLVDAGTSTERPLQQSMADSSVIAGGAGISPAEQTMRDAQIADLNKPVAEQKQEAAKSTLSTSDMLAKLNKPQ